MQRRCSHPLQACSALWCSRCGSGLLKLPSQWSEGISTALCGVSCLCEPRSPHPDAPSGADSGLPAEPGQPLLPAAGGHAGGLQCCPGFADWHAATASSCFRWAPAWATAWATAGAPTRAAPPAAAAASSAPAAHDGLHVHALPGGLLSASSRDCWSCLKSMSRQACRAAVCFYIRFSGCQAASCCSPWLQSILSPSFMQGRHDTCSCTA